jgi:hypothetical protein
MRNMLLSIRRAAGEQVPCSVMPTKTKQLCHHHTYIHIRGTWNVLWIWLIFTVYTILYSSKTLFSSSPAAAAEVQKNRSIYNHTRLGAIRTANLPAIEYYECLKISSPHKWFSQISNFIENIKNWFREISCRGFEESVSSSVFCLDICNRLHTKILGILRSSFSETKL